LQQYFSGFLRKHGGLEELSFSLFGHTVLKRWLGILLCLMAINRPIAGISNIMKLQHIILCD